MTTAPEIYARFLDIEAERRDLEQQIADRTDRIFRLLYERDEARSLVKRLEANITSNGGAGKVTIDGKNEKVREAQFNLACQEDKAWVDADRNYRAVVLEIEACERDIAVRQGVIKGKDLSMQMRISQMNYLSTPRYYKEA